MTRACSKKNLNRCSKEVMPVPLPPGRVIRRPAQNIATGRLLPNVSNCSKSSAEDRWDHLFNVRLILRWLAPSHLSQSPP